MNEKHFLIFSIVLIFVGIVSIALINRFVEVPKVKISEISQNMSKVKIVGKVINVYESKSKNLFLKVSDDTGTIDVVFFRGTLEVTPNLNNKTVEVIGEVSIYKNKLEIIGKMMKVIG